MFKDTNIIITGVSVLALICGYFLRKYVSEHKIVAAENKAKELLETAKRDIAARRKELEIEIKDLRFKIKSDFERETKDRRQELKNIERRLMQKEENLERKVSLMDKKEKDLEYKGKQLGNKERELQNKSKELDSLILEEKQRLQRVSRLTADEAKTILLKRMEDEVKHEASIMIKRIEDEAKAEADKRSKNILSLTIQKCAAEHTVESTVSVVSLPNDEMKGRIIGREGRNIRALEIATGIDVIVDDTPEAVILSGFDIVRREIARLALEKLISDGRIHPGRIEEVVQKAREYMEKTIREEGEKIVFDIGVRGLHPELVRLIGRLKYRTSYGQNVLQHIKEVSYLMGVMANELRLDFHLARRIGLLHDLGKAVDHEVQGSHAVIGGNLAKKYGENDLVINAIAAHHEDVEAKSIYAVLVQAADAISATRPGARRETLESYIKRLEKLESIAESFEGVDKTYAIQAGREIRVIVKPDIVGDDNTAALARNITKKVEEGLEYPGQIKVTVIRETRAIEYAK